MTTTEIIRTFSPAERQAIATARQLVTAEQADIDAASAKLTSAHRLGYKPLIRAAHREYGAAYSRREAVLLALVTTIRGAA